ncbi:hypothetical protein [Enterobacter hormaechei]|uniref:hypothetical protein n=1 Tax=Enterobacter hormaechei TaxID=158836 RepID=UPI003C2D41B2
MDTQNKVTVASESYCYNFKARAKRAVKKFEFWRELFLYFFIGSMGLWVPYAFELSDNALLFDPINALTFGVATLCVILEARIFMSDSDDRKMPEITKLIVLGLTIVLVLTYIKGVKSHGGNIFLFLNWVNISLGATIILWFIHHVNSSRYDSESTNGMLGGDFE